MNLHEIEEREFHTSSQGEWDRADAWQRGEESPESPWVLTDRDVWHKNPYFDTKGFPYPPHPEDESEEFLGPWLPYVPAVPVSEFPELDDCPF